jgi:glycosyltransferase involved in cell wall biosynthesis
MNGSDISVLMPSYGYGRFLRDAIESILQQTGPSVEIIVQDAGSEDDSLEILRGYEGRVSWRSEQDEGQSDALNRALERASGDWIAWLNADEFYLPGSLQHLFDAAIRTDADVVYGDAMFVDEHGRSLRLLPQHPISDLVIESYGTFISTCASLFRRRALPESPWDVSLKRVMDWDLYLRLLRQGGRFVHTPYPVAAFRVHEAQVTATRTGSTNEYQKVRTRYDIEQTPIRRARAYAAHAALKLGHGSYLRQAKVRRGRGTSLRWFAPTEGDGVGALFSAYGLPPPTTHSERVE